ncbi:MAG: DUF5916 domain-containing protein [Gemmatimonadota bacterium]|nr:carbohydrate binding family 9 domain-containing protein [Gemmatimonadota bacterium]
MPHRRLAASSLVGLFALALPPVVAAQTADGPEPDGQPRRPRAVEAVPTTAEIRLDGRLDEAAWAAAPPAADFVQREPQEGAPPGERSEVRILFDDEALYVGARLHDDAPGTIGRQLVRRDDWGQYDFFEVALDPNLDRRTGYLFRVSASNVQRDEYLYDDSNADDAWNAVWTSAVQIDDGGWTVEIRIPFSQIRYEAPESGRLEWGINFNRRKLSTNETSQYALVSRQQAGVVSQFAPLRGVNVESGGHRIELRPYVLSRAFTGPEVSGDPFRDGSDVDARTGVDLRYGLGSQFTLDVTINPDFGQVEADPAVINLSAFEVFFDERRPFFVEDARIFDFQLSGGRNRLYYSRRVGREPQGDGPAGAAFLDAPDAATILGAAKLTGRTSSGLSIGVLAASTSGERGRAFFQETGLTSGYLAEPRTHSGVVRLRQDFNEGASTIGGIVTGMHRELPGDGSFDFLTSNAFNIGLDWEHQWSDRTWAFFGYVAGSYVEGDSTAVLRIQRSSNHFFQRPDADRLSIDSTLTSLAGVDWRMTLAKRRGRHWTGSIWAAQVTPGFEVNDLGFSGRQEVLDGGVRVSYQEIQPGSWYRSYEASVSTFHNWTHDVLEAPLSWDSWGRGHVNGSINLNGEVEFQNLWEIDAGLSFRPERMDRTASRGGPLVLSPRSYSVNLGVRSDSRRAFSVSPRLSYEWSDLDAGWGFDASADVEYRPSSRVEIRLEPEWSRSNTGAQYVRTSDALEFPATYGLRYLFADLEQRELSLETRISVTVSPTLSLQLFAQPLLSSGDFAQYKQLARPESFEWDRFAAGTFSDVAGVATCSGGRTCVDADGERYLDYDGDGVADDSFGDRSFNVRSLIGNAVLRWEYRPGSTVFLVWQRRQESRIGLGDFDVSRDLDALLGAQSENVFIVKVNYWLSP